MDINFFGQKFNHQNNLKLSDDFLTEHPDLKEKIDDLNWAYNEIGGVIPQYIGKLGYNGLICASDFGLCGFFVKFGADYPEFERTTFRLNSSNPALPYISLFLFFNLFT